MQADGGGHLCGVFGAAAALVDRQAQVELTNAQAELKRSQGLQAQGLISPQAVDAAQTRVRAAMAAVQAAQAGVVSAEAQVKAECDSELVAHLLTAEADKKRRQRMKGALRVAADRLNAAVACAELFDDTMELKDCLKGLEEAIKARREAFEVTLTAMVGI